MTRLPYKLAQAIEKRPHLKKELLEDYANRLRNKRLQGCLTTQGHTDLLAIEQELQLCV